MIVRALIVLLLAPLALWLGFTQPLWHVLGIALALATAAGLWRLGCALRSCIVGLHRWQECAGGIHFFLTREEAEAY